MVQDGTTMGSGPPPAATLLQVMTGYWPAQAVYVAAKLGVADLLADGAVDCEQLAAATNTDAGALHRLLRALASIGIFAEVSHGRFELTPLAALLRTGTPDSLRSLAITYNEELYRAWGELRHSVRTGQPAFEYEYKMPVFEYFAAHPEADRVFNEAMIGWTTQVAGAVVSSYDFAPFETVVDVGGGYGTLLAAILKSNGTARGILFDQPHVVAAAADVLRETGVADRCECVGGDFFAGVPTGGDAYVLAQIIHDWDDDRCVTILQRCRQAMPSHGRLLVVDYVVPAGNEPFFGKWLDLHMLVVASGRERMEPEFAKLFNAAGFTLSRVIPTSPGPSVLEAVPVPLR